MKILADEKTETRRYRDMAVDCGVISALVEWGDVYYNASNHLQGISQTTQRVSQILAYLTITHVIPVPGDDPKLYNIAVEKNSPVLPLVLKILRFEQLNTHTREGRELGLQSWCLGK